MQPVTAQIGEDLLPCLWEITVDTFLVDRCQQHLIHALRARMQHTEQMVGDQFGFEIIQRDATTAFLAHRWPHAQDKPAFHRVFNFIALPDIRHDPLLERLVDERLDAVVEVLPGKDADAAATVLRAYHYQPVWSIPWLSIPLQSVTPSPAVYALVPIDTQPDLTALAEVLTVGYGYTGEEASAWRTFATYGYGASGFIAFLAALAISLQQRASCIWIMSQPSWMGLRPSQPIVVTACKKPC
jgi:hypothetical protein